MEFSLSYCAILIIIWMVSDLKLTAYFIFVFSMTYGIKHLCTGLQKRSCDKKASCFFDRNSLIT